MLVTGVQVGFTLLAYLVPLEYGMLVIVAGMFFGNWTLAIVFVLYARRQIGSFGLRSVAVLYVRLGLASALAGFAAWAIARLVLGRRGAETEATGLAIWGWQFLSAGIASGLVFIAVFLVAVRLLRISEFGVLNHLRRLRLPQIG